MYLLNERMVPTACACYTIFHVCTTGGRALLEETEALTSIQFSAHSRVTLTKSISQSLGFLILGRGIKQSYPIPQQAFIGINGEHSVNIQITKRTKEIRMTEANTDLLVYLSNPCASLFTVLF